VAPFNVALAIPIEAFRRNASRRETGISRKQPPQPKALAYDGRRSHSTMVPAVGNESL
jgi:hypothetical protein